VIVTAADGTIIWNRAATVTLCMFGQSISLRPGRVATDVVRWSARRCAGRAPTDCPDSPAPPGTYRIAVRWLGAGITTLHITS
jgi:hypothetical protein